jgi:hypothetical protein
LVRQWRGHAHTVLVRDDVIGMLRQPEGATVDEVASVTGWQRHMLHPEQCQDMDRSALTVQ